MRKQYVIILGFLCLLAGVLKATLVTFTKNHFPECTLTASASVTSSGGSTICLGSSATLSATASGGTSPYTYAWLPPRGLNNAAIANPVATPSVSTNYSVTITDHAGCTASASVSITVEQPPTVNPDSLLMQYLTNRPLTATGGVAPYTYVFSPPISTASLVALLTSTVTTVYTITVTGANGCGSTYNATYIPLSGTTTGACSTIFMSEYIQDTVHDDDGIELYNPTTSSINLGNYYLVGTTNGSLYATPFFIRLHGTIAAHSTFLIANTNADTALAHKAKMLSDSLSFGGKDIVALAKIAISVPNLTCTFLDMVGAISPLPTDSGWAVGSGSTKNHTLVRQSSVTQGDMNWATCKAEWNVYARGTYSYIGHYNNVCTPEDAILYFSFANDSVICGNPDYYTFDIMIQADSAKILDDADVMIDYPAPGIEDGVTVTMGPDFLADSTGANYAIDETPTSNSLTIQLYAQADAHQQEVVDSIPKVYAHVKLKIANSCETGDIKFDPSIFLCHYVVQDSTYNGQDSTVHDSLSNEHYPCYYQCNPYPCDSFCCDTDVNGNCIDTCWLTCYNLCADTCYDTTRVVHYYNVYTYSNYHTVAYSDVVYTGSIPLLTCSPVIEPLQPVNAGTNAASDPANSSILTIKGSGFGRTKGLIQVPDADTGGAKLLVLDSTDILSWSENQIVVKMPAVLQSYSGTPGSGNIFVTSDCGGTAEKYLTINYNIIGQVISDEKLRYNIAMSDDTNSIVFRCDTSISNHPRIQADVLQAISEWNCYTGINWKMGSDTILENSAQDGVSVIYFTNSLPPNVLMETQPHIDYICDDLGDSMAYVHEVDIAIGRIPYIGYSWNYDVSDTAFPGINFYFYDLLLHELGHGHLLNHVDDTNSVMYWQADVHARRNLLTGAYPGPQTLYAGFDVVNTSAANTPSCSYGKLIPSPRICIDGTLAVPSISSNNYNLTLYPNPISNQELTISYELTQDSYVQFKIIDYIGREVMALGNKHKLPGTYKEQINTDEFVSGIYLLIANINGSIQTIKFIKL